MIFKGMQFLMPTLIVIAGAAIYLKFIYSEKATKFCEIFTLLLSCVVLGTIHLRRRHVLGGGGGSRLPMFADARGALSVQMDFPRIFEANTKCNNNKYV